MKNRIIIFKQNDDFVINIIAINQTIPNENDCVIKDNSILINNKNNLKDFIKTINLEVICWFQNGAVYGWIDSSTLNKLIKNKNI